MISMRTGTSWGVRSGFTDRISTSGASRASVSRLKSTRKLCPFFIVIVFVLVLKPINETRTTILPILTSANLKEPDKSVKDILFCCSRITWAPASGLLEGPPVTFPYIHPPAQTKENGKRARIQVSHVRLLPGILALKT